MPDAPRNDGTTVSIALYCAVDVTREQLLSHTEELLDAALEETHGIAKAPVAGCNIAERRIDITFTIDETAPHILRQKIALVMDGLQRGASTFEVRNHASVTVPAGVVAA